MKRTLVIGLSLIGLISCGSGEHTKLCKKDAGMVIYKQVEANGFYNEECNSSCWFDVLKSYERTGLTFLEFKEEKAYRWTEITENGYWRYFIAEKDNPLCNKKIIEKLDSYKRPNKFIAEFRETKCVAAKKLNKPEAKYWFIQESNAVRLNNLLDSDISKSRSYILDIETGDIVSESINYILDRISGTPNEGSMSGCKGVANDKEKLTPRLYESTIRSNHGE